MIKRFINAIKKKYENPTKYWRKLGAKIGDGGVIFRTAHLGSEPYLIEIGNHVRINEGVRFVTHDGGAWVLRQMQNIENAEEIDIFGKITVGNNVHIGTNAIIMPGVEIGNNVIIGCGAIVTKSIGDNQVAVGVPARIIESIDEYIKKNQSRFFFTKSMLYDEKKHVVLNRLNNTRTSVAKEQH